MDENTIEKTRQKAIATISNLFPPDVHVTTGHSLLVEAVANSWRDLPLPMLLRLAELNEEAVI
jgi:hypothetical protein